MAQFVHDLLSGDDTITGSSGADTILGFEGNDTLIGGARGDVLEGGLGNDTYYVDTDLDQVRDPGSFGGYDRVFTSATFRLHQDLALVEELQTTNRAATTVIDLYGSKSANLIVGNAGVNTLDGRGGNDTLIGGRGGDALIGGDRLDTASYATASAGLFAGLEEAGYNTGDAAGDSYSGIENLTGSAF